MKNQPDPFPHMETRRRSARSPEPWTVEDDGHLDHEGKFWIVDARGLCVAEVESYDDAHIGPMEAEKNSDLLAAAPALLEIAKARVYAGHDSDCKAQDERKTCDCGHDDACAAVAKAEGR